MKINNLINVKTISIGPIISKELIFEKFEDIKHFVGSLEECENRIRFEAVSNKKIYLTKVCKRLHDCFIELGFMPRALPKPSTDMDYFIEFIWDLDNANKNYKDFYCDGSSTVIDFEYNNPVRTPEGWKTKLTIWFNNFTSEEVL